MFQLDVVTWSNECSVERCAAVNKAKTYVATPLMVAAQSGKM
jgi:hypothetical protein